MEEEKVFCSQWSLEEKKRKVRVCDATLVVRLVDSLERLCKFEIAHHRVRTIKKKIKMAQT